MDSFFNCPPLKEGQNGMVERDGACISGYPLKLSNACVLLISAWYRSFYLGSTMHKQKYYRKIASVNVGFELGNQDLFRVTNQMQKDSLLVLLPDFTAVG